MKREELIEEAAKAMAERVPGQTWEDCDQAWYLAHARVAFAVFEKAQAPTPFNGKWVCGKCAREVAQGVDDGQIPEHHRTCHKRAQTEPTDAQCDAITQALIDHDARSLTCYDHDRVCCPCGVHDMARLEWQRHRARAAFTAGQEEQS